jgi:hypothetical protein
MLGSLFGRVLVSAARSVAAVAANAAAAELRKPETQAKIGQAIAIAHQQVTDPERRAALERAAGDAGKSAARALGRAAGTLRNKIGGS